MSIQPGVGLSFNASSSGTTLDINPVWSSLVSVTEPYGPEQFKVEVSNNEVQIAKGRVITQDIWEGTSKDATTVEFSLNGVWAYPTGSKTAGSDASSPWMDNGGTITIANAANEGSDYWGVYIVRQPFNKTGQKHTAELIVIDDNYLSPSDAYEKTTPWGEADTTDSIRLISVANATSVTVDGSPAGDFITSVDANPSQYNYNCQRVKVASLFWDATTSTWTVTQHLIGSITLPNIIQYYGIQLGVDGARPDTYWPNYETECDEWNGTWTGYTKASSTTATVIVPVGFPT